MHDPDHPIEAALDDAQAALGEPVTPDHSRAMARHPWLFLAIGLAAGAVLLLALLGATIARGSQFAFDRAILLAMRDPVGGAMVPEGPGWLKSAMIDITALGGGTVLTMVVVGTIGLLLLQRHLLTAALLAGGVVSGSLAVVVGKAIVGRARPDVIDHLVEVGSASFPSGHSANSAIVYLTLAMLLVQIVRGRAQRLYLVALAAALTAAIGVSRVYLGVHWPSDVLAGWSFGALWALGWWSLGAWIRARGR